jgi:hypothetical protein
VGDIRFKSLEIAHNFCDVRIHPKLTNLLMYIADLTGEVIITSARRYRTVHPKDTMLHMTDPLRAVDIRHYIYNDYLKLKDTINSIFQYDSRRPTKDVIVFHDIGLGSHFHCQVHPRTTKIK